MGITVSHNLSATTPDDPSYEIRPSHWNSAHAATLSVEGSEVIGAFSNAGNVSFALETNGRITATANVTAAAAPVAVTAGTSSGNLQTIAFSNSNGMSFGLNGSTITASHNALTTARASNDAVGLNTALTAGPLAWTVNSAGISLNAGSAAGTSSGFTGGASISGSMTHNTAGLAVSLSHPAWITTARASNDGIGLNTAQSNVTWTANSAGLSLDARGYAGTGTSATNASVTLNSNGLAISVAAPGAGGGIAAAAGTQTATSGTVNFANSNNITFGMSGSSQVTASFSQTNQTLGLYGTGNTTNNSSTTRDARSLTIEANGGISAGFSNGSIQLSAPGTSSISGTGAVSISVNGSTVSIGVGTVTATAASNTTQASSGSINLNGLVFAGAGGASVGISNGSVVISGATGGGANFSAGVSTGGNTAGSTGVTGTRLVFAGGNNITLSQSTDANGGTLSVNALSSSSLSATGIVSLSANGNTISVGAPAYSAGVSNLGNTAGDTGMATARVVFVGSNNITLSGSTNGGSATISISGGGAGGNFSAGASNLGNTAGATGITGTQLVLVGSNNISLSQTTGANGGTLTINGPASSSLSGTGAVSLSTNGSTISVGVGTVTMSATGNTTQGSSGTVNLAGLIVRGDGVASAGVSNGSIVLSVANAGGADGFNRIVAGTQTAATLATVEFLDSNGITFGMSNSSQITASHNGLTSQSNQALSGSNGSFAFQTATFGNLNGLSFYTSNGSMVGSYTVPTQSNQTVGIYGSSQTTGQSSSSTIDARSLTVRGAGIVSVGMSGGELLISATGGGAADGGVGISAGANSVSNGTVVLSNSNNVSFGLNGSTVTATATFAQTNQSAIRAFGVSNTGQTAGNTGVSTGIDWVIAGSNSITLSQSTAGGGPNTVWIQHPAWLTTAAQSDHSHGNPTLALTNLSGTTASNSAGLTLSLSAAAPGGGNFSAGVSTGGNTAGSTGISGSQLVLVGTNAVSLSQSTGANGATVSINVASQTNQTVGMYALGNTTQNSSSTFDARTLSLNGLGAMTVGYSNGSIQLSAPASSSLVGATGLSVSSNGSTISVYEIAKSIYRQMGQITAAATAQGNSLVSVQPFVLPVPVVFSNVLVPISVNVTTSGNNSSGYVDVSATAVFYTRNSVTLGSVGSFNNTYTVSFSSNATGTVTGVWGLALTGNSTALTPGEYYAALHISTNNTATGGANTTALANTVSVILSGSIGSAANLVKIPGQQTNASLGVYPGQGLLSTGATLSTINIGNITATGTRGFVAPFAFELRNETAALGR